MAVRPTPPPDIPSALAHFDALPDSGYVRAPVVAGLFGCSENTVWRRSKTGDLPAPVRLSPGVTGWNVGALRRRLAGTVEA